MYTPIIETERLILRPLLVTDAEELFKNAALEESVNFIIYNADIPVPADEDEDERPAVWEEDDSGGDLYSWEFVLKSSNRAFGSGVLKYREGSGLFEVGYNVMKSHFNRGLAVEATDAIVGFVKQRLKEESLPGRIATAIAAHNESAVSTVKDKTAEFPRITKDSTDVVDLL